MTASTPGAEADASAEGQSPGLADAAMMPAAAAGSNPLRQKSSLWAARETEDDDAQAAARDVIPSLPRVTYSDGGMQEWRCSTVYFHCACMLQLAHLYKLSSNQVSHL